MKNEEFATARHAVIRWASLVGITLVMLAFILHLSYKEDIQDFLPLSETDRERMAVYQDISGMNRLFVIFETTDNSQRTTDKQRSTAEGEVNRQKTTEAIDCFVETVESSDTAGWCRDMQATFDLESLSETLDFVYQNIPLFLKEEDYRRMDSLLALPNFMDERLEDDLSALMFPSGDIISQNIGRDPLGLFAPALEELWQSGQQMRFEMYDGYIFTPDMSRAIVMLSSPFGSSETKKNAQLVSLLEEAIERMQADFPDVKAHVIGGPQIAVGNARQIMHDSILAISLAAVLILALLLYAFRRIKDIALIALSVLWGWLFALGGMALVHDSVSMIVIGISSIIIGIAVNYPLHLISHVQHQPDTRQALREITKPLLVGNITTVGAFLALVPLKSVALRDLGLFASFLLIGTILFVLVWLPHFVRTTDNRQAMPDGRRESQRTTVNCQLSIVNYQCHDFLTRLASIQIERKKWLICLVAVLTLVFGYFSLSTEFDSDVSHINYMTAEQKEDMALLEETGLMVSKEKASQLLPSSKEQEECIVRWNEWVERHPQLTDELNAAAQEHGFADGAFTDFMCQMKRKPVEASLPDASDVASLHSAVADALSDDFNYIGWACSLIVFFFLWLSFKSIKLAIISFIPMAISWVWILGIMSLLGIKFNIVNIILATFIFGQGDDYTIFMTEGCVSEHEHGKPVLAPYKRSIILSALIMFIGIGTLIFAKHPALHSLAEVTIIGMFSVVLMAYLIPPLLYKWMMKTKSEE